MTVTPHPKMSGETTASFQQTHPTRRTKFLDSVCGVMEGGLRRTLSVVDSQGALSQPSTPGPGGTSPTNLGKVPSNDSSGTTVIHIHPVRSLHCRAGDADGDRHRRSGFGLKSSTKSRHYMTRSRCFLDSYTRKWECARNTEHSLGGNRVEYSAGVDIEHIKQLKARYCRYIDTKDWEGLRSVFADDAVSGPGIGVEGGEPTVGAAKIVDRVERVLGSAQTVHRVFMPEIEIISAEEARAVWAFEDRLWGWVSSPATMGALLNLQGFGRYHETYVKQDGCWRIATTRIHRLRMELV